jgi:hypothetical protein
LKSAFLLGAVDFTLLELELQPLQERLHLRPLLVQQALVL